MLILLAMLLAADSPEIRARQVLDLFLTQKYDEIYARLAAGPRAAISLENFRIQSAQLEQLGAPVEIGQATVTSERGLTVAAIPVRWAAASLEFRVAWNAAGEIVGTGFRNPPPPPSGRPAYSKPDSFTDREVTVGSDEWKLPGTLSMPNGKGPFPAVVLVHGSGPHDRDETIGPNKVFRDLAEGLASRGVAVLRYEKRTRAHRAEAEAAAAGLTMTAETVEDALRAAALLRETSGIDAKRIFVLGHSQGGYMMPRILAGDAKLAGGIVMAGNARPLEALVLDQLEYLAGLPGASEEQRKALASARKDPSGFLRLPERYLRDLKDYDPVSAMRAVTAPVLFLQGTRDYQVTLRDLELWRDGLRGRTNVRFITYSDLNHLFMQGSGRSTPSEYQKAGHMQELVIQDIADWISRNSAKAP